MVFDMVKLRKRGMGTAQHEQISPSGINIQLSSATAYTAANVPIYEKRNHKTEEAKNQ